MPIFKLSIKMLLPTMCAVLLLCFAVLAYRQQTNMLVLMFVEEYRGTSETHIRLLDTASLHLIPITKTREHDNINLASSDDGHYFITDNCEIIYLPSLSIFQPEFDGRCPYYVSPSGRHLISVLAERDGSGLIVRKIDWRGRPLTEGIHIPEDFGTISVNSDLRMLHQIPLVWSPDERHLLINFSNVAEHYHLDLETQSLSPTRGLFIWGQSAWSLDSRIVTLVPAIATTDLNLDFYDVQTQQSSSISIESDQSMPASSVRWLADGLFAFNDNDLDGERLHIIDMNIDGGAPNIIRSFGPAEQIDGNIVLNNRYVAVKMTQDGMTSVQFVDGLTGETSKPLYHGPENPWILVTEDGHFYFRVQDQRQIRIFHPITAELLTYSYPGDCLFVTDSPRADTHFGLCWKLENDTVLIPVLFDRRTGLTLQTFEQAWQQFDPYAIRRDQSLFELPNQTHVYISNANASYVFSTLDGTLHHVYDAGRHLTYYDQAVIGVSDKFILSIDSPHLVDIYLLDVNSYTMRNLTNTPDISETNATVLP